ncbi:transcription factor bHLH113 [Amborella trichopoda]|uniref:transcription factor bHLH113 n=1 Tax=Amborella trichopoda TaxID=13333 RepID=UPI0005D3DE54|nr:transcription factor bHLH113 [Amborella trichopoda]|eukprot:XP_011625214.1 transcription factor bHLH113 [Amborella trichopoda]
MAPEKGVSPAIEGFSGNSFAQLLDSGSLGLEMREEVCRAQQGLVSPKPHFSGFKQGPDMLGFHGHASDRKDGSAPSIPGISGSDSSSSGSSNSSRPKSSVIRSDVGEASIEHKKHSGSVEHGNGEAGVQFKKPKVDSSASVPLKVRKEKLGERITALQQLVSPYGKTDTASVLHEAMGYIRFLHDQVQVLSTPYLQRIPPSSLREAGEEESKYDLRSRGLCLVPVSCTLHVASSNGADFWAPAMASNSSKY